MNSTSMTAMKTMSAARNTAPCATQSEEQANAGHWHRMPAAFLAFWIVNVSAFLYYAAKSGWTHLALQTHQ